MRQHIRRWFGVAFWLVTVLGLCGWVGGSALPSLTSRDIAGPLCSAAASVGRTARPAPSQLLTVRAGPVDSLPGMPAVADPKNLYSATAADRLSPAVAGTPSRVYVPNRRSNSVYVIDPASLTVVDRLPVGFSVARRNSAARGRTCALSRRQATQEDYGGY